MRVLNDLKKNLAQKIRTALPLRFNAGDATARDAGGSWLPSSSQQRAALPASCPAAPVRGSVQRAPIRNQRQVAVPYSCPAGSSSVRRWPSADTDAPHCCSCVHIIMTPGPLTGSGHLTIWIIKRHRRRSDAGSGGCECA